MNQTHTAHFALLADGPYQGERRKIEPGQLVLEITGSGNVLDVYAYEGPTRTTRDTVLFTYREQRPASA
jgi:hypothetical protein